MTPSQALPRTVSYLLATFCLCAAMGSPSVANATGAVPSTDGKIVLGRLEQVYLSGIEQLQTVGIPGKIDTGADTTSIHAEKIRIYSKNPKFSELEGEALLKSIAETFGDPADEWWLTEFDTPERNLQTFVSFELRHPYSGETLTIERPLSRISAIQARGEHAFLYRPVIELDLTIAGRTVHTEVNLADRSGFSYPILIGKTFLRGNAWVDAGIDYLSDQDNALIIGHKEHAKVEGLTLDTSVSLANRYSALHARKISIDQENRSVTMTLEGRDNKKTTITRPLERMLSVSGKQYPLVYIPVELGKAPQQFKQPLLVYLKDRSKLSTQLHLGTEALSQFFLVDLAREQLGREPLQTLSERPKKPAPQVITPLENVTLNGVALKAEPSTRINTSLLLASNFNEFRSEDKRHLQITLIDEQQQSQVISAPIIRKIKVGDEVRPVIEARLQAPGLTLEGEVAVAERELSPDQPQLLISPSLSGQPLLISTRGNALLTRRTPRKVGYIEQLELEGSSIPVKLDTGADLNSLHATDIERFELDGKQMVRFTFDHSGVSEQFTREVIGEMKIRARAGEQSEPRPIVRMQVGRDDVQISIRVNLQDRSAFNYGMILGKTFLGKGFWVSSDRQFLFTEKPKSK